MKATKVTAGLAESNGSLMPGLWHDSLHVTCGLTACTPGSAPGLTLGNEYGKTLLFYSYMVIIKKQATEQNTFVSCAIFLHILKCRSGLMSASFVGIFPYLLD